MLTVYVLQLCLHNQDQILHYACPLCISNFFACNQDNWSDFALCLPKNVFELCLPAIKRADQALYCTCPLCIWTWLQSEQLIGYLHYACPLCIWTLLFIRYCIMLDMYVYKLLSAIKATDQILDFICLSHNKFCSVLFWYSNTLAHYVFELCCNQTNWSDIALCLPLMYLNFACLQSRQLISYCIMLAHYVFELCLLSDIALCLLFIYLNCFLQSRQLIRYYILLAQYVYNFACCTDQIFFSYWVWWPVKIISLNLSQVNHKLGRKRENPEKNHLTTHKQNLACLTCDPSEAWTHSGEMTSKLEC